MIENIFPKAYKRYSSLPILGPVVGEFANFLTNLGYPRNIIRLHLRSTLTIDARLRQRECCSIKDITLNLLRACGPTPGHSQEDIAISAAIKLLERFFIEQKILLLPEPDDPIEKKVIEYQHYLESVRGFAPSTVHDHCLTVSQFLNSLNKNGGGLTYLPKLTSQDIENFVRERSKSLTRGSLQHTIAHLRAFLNYLVSRGEMPKGLDIQIDTPRIYRGEQLPRSLNWETVSTLLQSIDRSTAIGKRDYAMLSLMATYGLRASEIVTLKLENIEWRKCRFCIFQRKTGKSLLLPLTDAIGENIIDYLHKGRPSVPYREIFVRHRAPSGTLKPTAVAEVFQCWVRRSGLNIPFQGPHCLRHSYAVHLLRQGTDLKTIGDILGHRNFESTCVYLRLNIEDLRIVPLSLPVKLAPINGEQK